MKKLKSLRFGVVSVALLLLVICLSCIKNDQIQKSKKELAVLNYIPEQRPNIVWIVAEDLSPYVPSFGDSTVVTPNLSRLAKEGICYDNFFSPHPVCAPARASIITGMYANSIGASHMRTGPWFAGQADQNTLKNYKNALPPGQLPYQAVPPSEVKMFTEYMRSAGYYCTNNSKQDYQFVATPTSWDENGPSAHWNNRPDGQPFFSVFNIETTHESRIWTKAMDSLWVDPNLEIPIPPYLPNSDIAKNDIRRMYSNVVEMDTHTGQIIDELDKAGLLESTIIFWYTDHGGPLPRQKRLLYDSGIKVPLIIRYPGKTHAGKRDKRLISFIDLAPTMFSLADIEAPDYLQGTSFLGKNMRKTEPQYVFGAADRFDEYTDRIRSVRSNNFKYIKYYEPEKPFYLPIAYREQMPIMQELLRLKREDLLNAEQMLWFRQNKPEEELFHLNSDPHELHDLSNDPQYSNILSSFRNECETWVNEIKDKGLMPESELIQSMWPKGQQPRTQSPEIVYKEGIVTLSCETEGASIGYALLENESQEINSWKVYNQPFRMSKSQRLSVVAHRIGFVPSQVQVYYQ